MSRLSSSKTLAKNPHNKIVSGPKNYIPQHPMLRPGFHFQETEPGGEMPEYEEKLRQQQGLNSYANKHNVLQGVGRNPWVWNMDIESVRQNMENILWNRYHTAEINRIIPYYLNLIHAKQWGNFTLLELESKLLDDLYRRGIYPM